MHRMGSYFDHVVLPPPSIPPPTPPPTSSIPKPPQIRKLQPAPQLLTTSNPTLGVHPDKIARTLRPVDRVKRNLQRLRHENADMRQIHALNRRLASLTIADMSPKLVKQRILLLYEKGEHREAAAFIRRISPSTYRQVVSELPMDIFMESMPHTMPILEAIYGKLYFQGNGSSLGLPDHFAPASVIWQIVHFFACADMSKQSTGRHHGKVEMCGPWVSTCKRLLSVLISAEPSLVRKVAERRKALTKAIEGLGQHGLVGTSDESLMNLHDALREQFIQVQKSYQESIHRLDHLEVTSSKVKNVTKEPPVAQSHQRQLSLRVDEIQERLIKNKSVFNVVEPILENQSLDVLLGILQRRIELDKEVLFQFTQLKREKRMMILFGGSTSSSDKNGRSNPSVAPVLMRCQKGCQQVRHF